MSSLNFMELCRLCLVKDRVQIPIFEGEGDIRQIFLKIAACLPVKVKKDDKLPKKICDDCLYKLEMLYQFWNTTANAEKQLLEWLGEAAEDKKTNTEAQNVKQESLEQDPCSELAKSLSRVEAVLAEAREAESDNDHFASGKAETDSDDEPLSSLEPTTFVNVGLDGSGTNESRSQGEFLAPGAPSTSKTSNSTNVQTATSGDRYHIKPELLDMKDEEFEEDEETTDASPHKCLICGKKYAKEMSLYAHITSHSQDILNSQKNSVTSKNKKLGYVVDVKNSKSRLYNCKSCDFSTSLLKTIKLHSRSHLVSTNKENRSPEDYSVSLRGASNGSKLKNHNETDDTEFKCEDCEETFTLKQEFEYHKTDCSSDNRSYECDVCCKKYRDKNGLKSHIKLHHEPDDGIDDGFDDASEEKSFECDFCKKSFPSKRHIALHLRTHSVGRKKGRPKKAEEVKMENDVKIPKRKRMRIRVEKPFKCDEENCQYATSQYSLLKAHKFKHNPFYKCVTCQEKFPTRLELKNHMSTHGERPFKCDQCNKCYKDKHGLGWHKKVQHDPSRLKFTCELCGKTYPFDSLLTQHINLSHATEKQSVCDICGKNVSKTYLPMHRRTHGEKQYSCDICEKTFLEKAYLKRHKMVHTGEKPYVCSVCGNSFRQHSTLTIHMRTHTGDRPYKCVLCENAYKTHHNLKKHYKRSGHKLV